MKSGKPTIEVLDDEMAEVLRAKTGAERLRIASDMFASARKMIINSLRSQHADWNEQQVNAEASRRLLHGEVPSEFLI